MGDEDLSTWLPWLLTNHYVTSFLQGLATWVGQATGPTVTAAVGALWASAHARRRGAERQRNEAALELLKPRDKGVPLSVEQLSERIIEFHQGLLTAYAQHSLPSLKRNGVLNRYTLDAAELRARSNNTRPEIDQYLNAIGQFLSACWERTNRSAAINKLRDEAKEKFSSALAALDRKVTKEEETKFQKLGRYRSNFIEYIWPLIGPSPPTSVFEYTSAV